MRASKSTMLSTRFASDLLIWTRSKPTPAGMSTGVIWNQ
jgi:hypothetical protein